MIVIVLFALLVIVPACQKSVMNEEETAQMANTPKQLKDFEQVNLVGNKTNITRQG